MKLDLAEPSTRRAISAHANSSGSWHWSRSGAEVAAIAYVWSRHASELTLRYLCNGVPIKQTVRLVQTNPRWGGVRYWFACPITAKRVRALYLPAGAQVWGGRQGYGLTYQSQREGGLQHSIMRLLMHSGSPWAQPPLRAQSLMALQDDGRRRRREQSLERRNAVRRIARRQRSLMRG